MLIAFISRRKCPRIAQYIAPQLGKFIWAVETLDAGVEGRIGLAPFTARARTNRDHVNHQSPQRYVRHMSNGRHGNDLCRHRVPVTEESLRPPSWESLVNIAHFQRF